MAMVRKEKLRQSNSIDRDSHHILQSMPGGGCNAQPKTPPGWEPAFEVCSAYMPAHPQCSTGEAMVAKKDTNDLRSKPSALVTSCAAKAREWMSSPPVY